MSDLTVRQVGGSGVQQSLGIEVERCRPIYAVHGVMDAWACMGCGRRYHLGQVNSRTQKLPACPKTLTGSYWDRVVAINNTSIEIKP